MRAPSKAGRPSFRSRAVQALLPIVIFVIAVIAVNVYEFGRPD
jgi:hypothetical protein